jgi:hypothetical protein
MPKIIFRSPGEFPVNASGNDKNGVRQFKEPSFVSGQDLGVY